MAESWCSVLGSLVGKLLDRLSSTRNENEMLKTQVRCLESVIRTTVQEMEKRVDRDGYFENGWIEEWHRRLSEVLQ